jgi:hypothetical protein
MKTKRELVILMAVAGIAAKDASDAMGRAESILSDAQNRWGDLRKAELDAKRAVDEWKEPVEPIKPVIPFV